MADDSIRVEYNQDLKPLEELLSGVERAGDFFVSGAVEIPMPKLETEGVGVLSFPVPPIQMAELIAHATRAPYGRGEETILDESVRKVWQLTPDKVRIGGKSWAASFDGILKQVIAGLGCEGMVVSAEIYKLLVYDTGGFFLTHRDTEKADGMFGTLVVVLPSAHRGGELVIRHAGREVTVEMSGAEFSEVSFAAFYADCEHEVRPITQGNRVCLVYNLIQQRGAKGHSPALHAPDYEKQIAAAAELLEKNLAAPGAAAKVAWLLEHQYSPDGLSFSALKSADAARVKVLAQAAERAGCAAHLGIVHIEESGSAQENCHDHPPRGWGRYRDDEEDEDDSSSEDFEVIEVCNWRHYVDQWRDLQDQPVEFGEIPIAPGELLPAGALDDEQPDEQRLMEASGNEGASFERSYHRVALVIWRRERYAEVLLQAGVAAVLPYLKERLEACGEKGSPPGARKEAASLARMLVNAWKDAPEYSFGQQRGRPGKRDGMLRLLIDLGDAALLGKFIAEVVTRDYDGSENAALVAGARLLGAEKTAVLFAELIRPHMRLLHGHCVGLLNALARILPLSPRETSGERGSRKKEASAPRSSPPSAGEQGEEPEIVGRGAAKQEWKIALQHIAEAAVAKLDDVGKKSAAGEWMDWLVSEKARAVDATLVANLLDVLNKLDAPGLRGVAAQKFAARPEVFDPVTVIVSALGLLDRRDDEDTAFGGLWEHSAEFLLRRSERPPEPPQDWRQDVKLSCSCADCRELQAFTLDPVEQTHRFRVRQDRRQHLHQEIEKHSLDMTHVTERKGSPQTLVGVKDRRGYQSRCEQYRKDIDAMRQLVELSPAVNGKPASLLVQLNTAVGRGNSPKLKP